VRPPLSRPVLVALCLAANAGILLAPALLIALDPRTGGLRLGLFLVGASALCLADVAGQDDRLSLASSGPRNPSVDSLAWAQALSVFATLQAGLLEYLSGRSALPPDPGLGTLGAVLMLSGAALRYAAIRSLGPHFVTDIRTGPELVRRGVYARMRHPSETGLLVAMAGSALLLSSTAALAVLGIVLVPVVVVRTRREDAALAAAFGADHARYAREAGRFLPRWGGKHPTKALFCG
jgi:protein-S-isoprenylcysteine O-methyltransferase Ste14